MGRFTSHVGMVLVAFPQQKTCTTFFLNPKTLGNDGEKGGNVKGKATGKGKPKGKVKASPKSKGKGGGRLFYI